MTKRRDNDLKERLKALRVNEPLKLNRDGVSMRPPQERKEVPQIEVPPHRIPRNEHPHNEQPQTETLQPKLPPRFERAQNEEPQIEKARTEVAQIDPPQKEAPQKEAHLIPQVEQPQIEEPQREIGTPQGFFKLSHGVFSEPLLKDLSGDCFRLFLWLSSRAWRFPSSGGVVRASVGYIEMQAGMSHATISRGLKTLKERGLISIVEVDFKIGNLWQVSSLACGNPSHDDKPPRDKAPQNEAARIVVGGASKNGTQSLKMRAHPPQNEQDLRSLKKNKNLKDVPKNKMQLAIELPQVAEASELKSEEVLMSFEEQLPSTERSKIINDFMAREFPHGFFPPMRVVKVLAAKDWFQASGEVRQLHALG